MQFGDRPCRWRGKPRRRYHLYPVIPRGHNREAVFTTGEIVTGAAAVGGGTPRKNGRWENANAIVAKHLCRQAAGIVEQRDAGAIHRLAELGFENAGRWIDPDVVAGLVGRIRGVSVVAKNLAANGKLQDAVSRHRAAGRTLQITGEQTTVHRGFGQQDLFSVAAGRTLQDNAQGFPQQRVQVLIGIGDPHKYRFAGVIRKCVHDGLRLVRIDADATGQQRIGQRNEAGTRQVARRRPDCLHDPRGARQHPRQVENTGGPGHYRDNFNQVADCCFRQTRWGLIIDGCKVWNDRPGRGLSHRRQRRKQSQ